MRVEAGDTIALSADVSPGQLGWVQDGPYFAYLSGSTYGRTISQGSGGLETDVLLGELQIETQGDSARASIEFTLPGDVPAGEYLVTVCNRPCGTGFGDLIGSTLFVGVDPPVDDGAVGASDASASQALAAVEAPDEAQSGRPAVPTGLTLAGPPARSTGLDASWVAISAAFGLVTLLLVYVVRTEDG